MRYMRQAKLVAVLVWLSLWIPFAATDAYASFKLERADGSRPVKGMNIAPLVDGAKTIQRYFEPPAPKVVKAVYRVPSVQSVGKCYTEPGTPPASVMGRESGGNPRVWNGGKEYSQESRGFSSASGCWQFIRSTWGGYKGYANAADAPVSVQNERAKQVWDGGNGYCHWHRCG